MAGFQLSIYGRFWVSTEELRTDDKTLHLKMKQYGIDAGPFRGLLGS